VLGYILSQFLKVCTAASLLRCSTVKDEPPFLKAKTQISRCDETQVSLFIQMMSSVILDEATDLLIERIKGLAH